MEYSTHYNIGDKVWLMCFNKAYEGVIEHISVYNAKSIVDYSEMFKEKYRVKITPNKSEWFGIEYLFPTKQSLIESL